jgi:hypothetical protein
MGTKKKEKKGSNPPRALQLKELHNQIDQTNINHAHERVNQYFAHLFLRAKKASWDSRNVVNDSNVCTQITPQ